MKKGRVRNIKKKRAKYSRLLGCFLLPLYHTCQNKKNGSDFSRNFYRLSIILLLLSEIDFHFLSH